MQFLNSKKILIQIQNTYFLQQECVIAKHSIAASSVFIYSAGCAVHTGAAVLGAPAAALIMNLCVY